MNKSKHTQSASIFDQKSINQYKNDKVLYQSSNKLFKFQNKGRMDEIYKTLRKHRRTPVRLSKANGKGQVYIFKGTSNFI